MNSNCSAIRIPFDCSLTCRKLADGGSYSGTPDLKGKVCVVTGGNTGIGKETAVRLAAMGAEVVLGCRSAKVLISMHYFDHVKESD